MDETIKVWDFWKAPKEYQELSQHGGDEEGVAFVPEGVEEPWWLERCWDMYGTPDRHPVAGGEVIIWAH